MNKYTLQDIAYKTWIYENGVNEKHDLGEEALANIEKFGQNVIVPYNEGKINDDMSRAIQTGLEMYYNEHPEKKVMTEDLDRTAKMQAIKNNGPTLALVKKEPQPLARAGFINIAILLYGILNIGIIVAIAFMK